MEIEGTWLPRGPHVGFVWKLIALASVAWMATRNEILPGRETAARTRNHMVERKFSRGKRLAAVLAGITIAQQYVFPRQST